MVEILHLGFHYVREDEAPGANCYPARLRMWLEKLANEHWEVLTCGEAARRMRESRPLPERTATLSFDDGLKDQHGAAFPLLKEFGVPATLFVNSCTLNGEPQPVIAFQILIQKLGAKRLEQEILPCVFAGTPYATLLDSMRYDIRDAKAPEPAEMRRIKWVFNHFPSQSFKRDLIVEMFARYLGDGSLRELMEGWFMSDGELIEMVRAGCEVASHSATHPPFDVSGYVEIEQELAVSKQRLAELLGKPPDTFGWPFGGIYGEKVKRLVARHYASAWNFLGASVMPPLPYELYDIPRLAEGSVFL